MQTNVDIINDFYYSKFSRGNIMLNREKIINNHYENFKCRRSPEEIFAPFYIAEFKQIMNEFNVKNLHNVTTDGIANIMSDKINNLSKEEYDIWVKYQLSICEREDVQGYSSHMLYICKKN